VTTLSAGGGGMGRQDRRVTFGQIKAEGLGCSGTADWVAVSVSCRAGWKCCCVKISSAALVDLWVMPLLLQWRWRKASLGSTETAE